MKIDQAIRKLVCRHYPDAQAIYRFGSAGTEHERTDSDLDIALLLPPHSAQRAGTLALGDLHRALEDALCRDVDLINLRLAPAVLQAQIVVTGTRIFCTDPLLADEFELLVLALYQKLNQERAPASSPKGCAAGVFSRHERCAAAQESQRRTLPAAHREK